MCAHNYFYHRAGSSSDDFSHTVHSTFFTLGLISFGKNQVVTSILCSLGIVSKRRQGVMIRIKQPE